MDNKAYIHAMATKLGCSADDVNRLTDGFAAILRRECAEQNRVAIPGFGSFEGIKRDEEIRRNPATGKRMLFPPCIEVKFKPSAMLNKRVNN